MIHHKTKILGLFLILPILVLSLILTTTPQPLSSAGFINVTAGNITSSKVTLAWPAVSGTDSIKIFMAAEPPAVNGDPLPNQVLLTALAGGAASYQVTNLAPAVENFFRVEAYDAGGNLLSAGNAQARTRGGPTDSKTLDNPAQEVHLMAPNIIQIILTNPTVLLNETSGAIVSGNTGSAWQAAAWTVNRANGNPISVQDVYRHSLPVANGPYKANSDRWQDGFYWVGASRYKTVDINHRLYLVLAENIGDREVLTVTASGGPAALNFKLPFSDDYLETPAIQVNQVGYHPQATERWAYVSAWLGDGGAMSLASFNQATVLKESSYLLTLPAAAVADAPVSLRAASDGPAGTEVKQINLAGVPAAENVFYRVKVPNVGVSWKTQVSQTGFFKAYYTVLRGLFHNRWCGDLSAPYTDWVRPPQYNAKFGSKDHCEVYTADSDWSLDKYPSNTPFTGLRPVVGGHHDAGDFDLRPLHVRVGHYLMDAFELNPSNFSDGQLGTPESGNGIPDLLDEALWNVQSWEDLQESDGAVRQGVEAQRHPGLLGGFSAGFVYANNDVLRVNEQASGSQMPYWTWKKDPNTTAMSAGIFARAARLVLPYNQSRSDSLKAKAISAYNYAKDNAANNSARLYAASELYRLTSGSQYKTDFETLWTAGAFNYGGSIWNGYFSTPDLAGGTRSIPSFALAYVKSPAALASITSSFASSLNGWAQSAKNETFSAGKGHRNARSMFNLNWGQGVGMGLYLEPVITQLTLGGLSAQTQQDYFNAMSVSADFLLGANPLSMTLYSQLGSRSPRDILHHDSRAFAQDKGMPQIPGIPVYGPTQDFSYAQRWGYTSSYPAVSNASASALPLFLRYLDTNASVENNEFDVWAVQAPNAMLFSALYALTSAPLSTAPNCWQPGQSESQNTLPASCGSSPLLPPPPPVAPSPPTPTQPEPQPAPPSVPAPSAPGGGGTPSAPSPSGPSAPSQPGPAPIPPPPTNGSAPASSTPETLPPSTPATPPTQQPTPAHPVGPASTSSPSPTTTKPPAVKAPLPAVTISPQEAQPILNLRELHVLKPWQVWKDTITMRLYRVKANTPRAAQAIKNSLDKAVADSQKRAAPAVPAAKAHASTIAINPQDAQLILNLPELHKLKPWQVWKDTITMRLYRIKANTPSQARTIKARLDKTLRNALKKK